VYRSRAEQIHFHHHAAGACVLLAAILAIMHRLRLAQWTRHWPPPTTNTLAEPMILFTFPCS